MKTFTLDEVHRNYALLKSLNIIELPSGAFTLESRERRETEEFATQEEAEAVLQCGEGLDGLVDAEVEVRRFAEPVVDENGDTSLREVGQAFCVRGYVVSRLDTDFATRNEADAVLSNAAVAFADALRHEFANKSLLPVVQVIDVEGGRIVVRQSSMLGLLYTLTDLSGNEDMTSTHPQLLWSPPSTSSVDPDSN